MKKKVYLGNVQFYLASFKWINFIYHLNFWINFHIQIVVWFINSICPNGGSGYTRQALSCFINLITSSNLVLGTIQSPMTCGEKQASPRNKFKSKFFFKQSLELLKTNRCMNRAVNIIYTYKLLQILKKVLFMKNVYLN